MTLALESPMPSSLVSVPAAARSAISAGSVLRTTSRARWNALARKPLSWARSRQCITRSRAASGVMPATVPPGRNPRPGTIGRRYGGAGRPCTCGEPTGSLAELNIGRLHEPLDHPATKEFVDALDEINALAEASPGFVWRLKDEATGLSSSYVSADDDPLNDHQPVGLGDARAAPRLRVPHGAHAVPAPAPGVVPEASSCSSCAGGCRPATSPTVEEAMAKLEQLGREGPSDDAFTLRDRRPAPDRSGRRRCPAERVRRGRAREDLRDAPRRPGGGEGGRDRGACHRRGRRRASPAPARRPRARRRRSPATTSSSPTSARPSSAVAGDTARTGREAACARRSRSARAALHARPPSSPGRRAAATGPPSSIGTSSSMPASSAAARALSSAAGSSNSENSP